MKYDQFVEKLKDKFRTSALASKRISELRRLKFDESQDGLDFVNKVRNILRVVEPNYTEDRICQIIRDKIPSKINRKIGEQRIQNNLEAITDILIYANEEYVERREKQNSVNSLRSDKFKRNKGYSFIPRKNLEEKKKLSSDMKCSEIVCFKCKKKGHFARNCVSNINENNYSGEESTSSEDDLKGRKDDSEDTNEVKKIFGVV